MDGSTSAAPAALAAQLQRQREAFLRDGPPVFAARRKALKRLREALADRSDDVARAISDDFGYRSPRESVLFEVVSVVQGIRHMESHLADWLAPQTRGTSFAFWPARNRLVFQPLGVIGVISPWNYPVALALTPLATAIAAGNRAMLKPSESTPRTSDFLRSLLADLFSEDEVAVITGDASVGEAFSRLPFDHLLFTGSTAVGRHVMRAASANLTPVTLELGGKSPAIIQRGSNLARAARRICYGKLANAGQTCVAPDYVLAHRSDVAAFAEAVSRETDRMYPDLLGNPDYSSIAADRHFDRLTALAKDAREKGARIIELGSGSGVRRHPRIMRPLLMLDVSADMAVMQEEIFGPILPVVAYDHIDEAIAWINERPRPLALYWFGGRGADCTRVLQRTHSGGVGVNEANLHYAQDDLPFGGVGESGMGAYHGVEGVRAMSHARAIFSQAAVNATGMVRPPFGATLDRLTRFMLR